MQRGACDKPGLSSAILGMVNGSSMGCQAVMGSRDTVLGQSTPDTE